MSVENSPNDILISPVRIKARSDEVVTGSSVVPDVLDEEEIDSHLPVKKKPSSTPKKRDPQPQDSIFEGNLHSKIPTNVQLNEFTSQWILKEREKVEHKMGKMRNEIETLKHIDHSQEASR